MGSSIWILEYRTRERKNGKWSEWASCDRADDPLSAYREYPSERVFAHEKYARRAIEYVLRDTQGGRGE